MMRQLTLRQLHRLYQDGSKRESELARQEIARRRGSYRARGTARPLFAVRFVGAWRDGRALAAGEA